MAALSVDGTPMPALPNSADQINYNNTTSGLSATTVKGAVDELASEKQDKSDDSLQTTDKTIPGAINELKNGLTNLEATHLSFQRYSGNNTSYTFNVSPNKTNSFRAAIAIQHNDTNPSIYILYMGVGLTPNVNIDKIFGNSSIIALSSASINGDVLTITYESNAYGGCSLLWLN